MSESETKLIGWINPNILYPAPMVAVVSSERGNEVVYPDGTSVEVSDILVQSMKVLEPEFQVPYRNNGLDEFIYGVRENFVFIGEAETVAKNLRLFLANLEKDSPDAVSVNEFLSSLDIPITQ